MRTLLYIPIIHTQADMGSLVNPVRRITLEKLGRRQWKNHIEVIDRFWRLIRQEIEKLDLRYSQVRLYQDGLPICEHETAIVAELAEAGSPNHLLLLDLMRKGAILMGTESTDLLGREYSLVQRALRARGLAGVAKIEHQQRSMRERLLEQRDRFIASRINETLGEEETGILFLGMLHSPHCRLAPDIRVSSPISISALRRAAGFVHSKKENHDIDESQNPDRG